MEAALWILGPFCVLLLFLWWLSSADSNYWQGRAKELRSSRDSLLEKLGQPSTTLAELREELDEVKQQNGQLQRELAGTQAEKESAEVAISKAVKILDEYRTPL